MNYFIETAANIFGNSRLRIPQIEAYSKALEHFASSNDDALIVLPTGTGKSGLISIVPFGLAKGRVLIITPGLVTKQAVALERADDLVEMVKRQPGRLMLVGAVVELLSRVGAWPQAEAAMHASWEAVPDTVPERRFKWYRKLHVIAVQFEAAVAGRDTSRQEALQTEWLQLETSLKEDEKQYASRRSALPSFFQPD